MNTVLVVLASVALGYLLGGIPFATLVARLRGVDISSVGTSNPGAANVFRRIGPVEGMLVGGLDVGKGTLAVLVGHWLGLSPGVALLGGAAAVAGHCYSPFLRFKGGAGLATAVGVGFGALPVVAAVGVAVALALIWRHRNVGVGAGLGYVAALATGIGLHRPLSLLIGATAVAAAVMVRNLLRDCLTEGRFKPPPPLDFLRRL